MKILSFTTRNIPDNVEERKQYLNDYFKNNIQGKSVVNIDTGLKIVFNKKSRHKTADRHHSKEITAVIKNIVEVLRNAQYNNFGEPKPKHYINFPTIKKFVNFKVKVVVDGATKDYRISCMILKDNKVQYDLHESSLEYAIATGKK